MDVLGESFKIRVEAAPHMLAAYLLLLKKGHRSKILNTSVLL
jgi:hypothetical protein